MLSAFGLYEILQSAVPVPSRTAAAAIKCRSGKKLSQSQVFICSFSKKIVPFLHIDKIKRVRLAEDLQSIGREITPEQFTAEALATSGLYTLCFVWLIPLSPILGIGVMGLTFGLIYSGQTKKVKEEISARRKKIDRELPQLASTIRQSLNTSRDIVKILESYRKICGQALLSEIDITLNDLKTGNAERALKNLESRVASPNFSELVRGLIGILRGDDQRVYFEMLAKDYNKLQNETLKQELLQRPSKLKPYVIMLLCSMVFIFIVAIGYFVINQLNILI